MKKQLLLGAVALSAATLGLSAQKASAFDLVGCPSLNPITSATACSYVDPSTNNNDYAADASIFSKANPPNPKINVNNVNIAGEDDGNPEGFFGVTTWVQAAKIDDAAESGSYNLSSINSLYDTVMAVFKGGERTTIVGYLLDGSNSFVWSNPWTGLGLSTQDISHISFYGANTCTADCDPPTEVPTPAAVLPILGGLFGFASRRKNEGSEEA